MLTTGHTTNSEQNDPTDTLPSRQEKSNTTASFPSRLLWVFCLFVPMCLFFVFTYVKLNNIDAFQRSSWQDLNAFINPIAEDNSQINANPNENIPNVTQSVMVKGNHLLQSGCYAPPLMYGGACTSEQAVVAQDPRTSVCYHFDAEADSTIYCQGLGYDDCSMGFHDVSFNNCLLWGSNSGYPSIQCYGYPTGTSFQWSYSVGVGRSQCSPHSLSAASNSTFQLIPKRNATQLSSSDGTSCCHVYWNNYADTCSICCPVGTSSRCVVGSGSGGSFSGLCTCH